jgi:hypothetical protein
VSEDGPTPPEPPRSQEEVVAHVLSEVRRRFDVLARAARRVESSDGPAGDAVRAVRDALRGVRGAVAGGAGNDGRAAGDGTADGRAPDRPRIPPPAGPGD